MKTCYKCEEDKEPSEFHKDKKSKDGLKSKCKSCVKDYNGANKEARAAYRSKYYQENKETLSAHRVVYYQENKEAVATTMAKYYQENKEAIAVQKAKYYQENKEDITVQKAKYRKDNPEKVAEISKKAHKKWIDANPKKHHAHCLVARAIARGELLKAPCEACGASGAQAHHDDYDKPLEVRWLCQRHHSIWHSQNGEGLNG